ncbi:MAG: cupredoxin domain-containing protein [Candidatus Shapirobacteria bacterium]
MNKKLPFNALLALVVFVVGVGLALGYLYFNQQTAPTSSSAPAGQEEGTIIPTSLPNNTPTPGKPRLENPTEDYKAELESNLQEQGVVQINITSEGFSPQNVEIKKGGVITWINNDALAHQIISSDQWGSFRDLTPNGGKYSQQFDVPGTYSYSSSANPNFAGQIIVSN